MKNLEDNKEFQELKNRRYHTYSDYDYTKQDNLKLLKIATWVMILRELPLRHFYARCFVVGVSLYYMNHHWWQEFGRHPVYYMNDRDKREFDNYPRLKEIVTKRIANKVASPTILEGDLWWMAQSPVFYHHHVKHYRYMWRHRREVAWDGTYNQPIVPYHTLNDRSAFVHAGLTETTEPKPNGAW
jgi:hypothetical protein